MILAFGTALRRRFYARRRANYALPRGQFRPLAARHARPARLANRVTDLLSRAGSRHRLSGAGDRLLSSGHNIASKPACCQSVLPLTAVPCTSNCEYCRLANTVGPDGGKNGTRFGRNDAGNRYYGAGRAGCIAAGRGCSAAARAAAGADPRCLCRGQSS